MFLLEKCKLTFPLSVGWTQLPAPKEQNVAEGEACTSETVMRSTQLALCLWITRSGGSQLHVRNKDPCRGSGHNSSLQVTVALVNTLTVA